MIDRIYPYIGVCSNLPLGYNFAVMFTGPTTGKVIWQEDACRCSHGIGKESTCWCEQVFKVVVTGNVQ